MQSPGPTTAVIGCGNIARFHFDGLRAAGAMIATVCDVNLPAAQAWAQKTGAAATDDYRSVIADPSIQLVVVTTPSRFHREICLAAIAAGKAIVCEKTLAESADDALAIVQAARSKGTVFYTSYMKRFIPAIEMARELLPKLGRLLTSNFRSHQCWGDLWTAAPESGFFHTPADGASLVRRNYGGGILACAGSHMVDLALYFLGRPSRVYASMHTPTARDYDLRATALLETDNGVCILDTLAHAHDKAGFLHDGWDERVELVGVNGRLEIFTAHWEQQAHKASLLRHYDQSAGTWTEHRFDAVSPFDRAVAQFCEGVRLGKQCGQSELTGYEADEVLAALTHSAETRAPVEPNWRID